MSRPTRHRHAAVRSPRRLTTLPTWTSGCRRPMPRFSRTTPGRCAWQNQRQQTTTELRTLLPASRSSSVPCRPQLCRGAQPRSRARPHHRAQPRTGAAGSRAHPPGGERERRPECAQRAVARPRRGASVTPRCRPHDLDDLPTDAGGGGATTRARASARDRERDGRALHLGCGTLRARARRETLRTFGITRLTPKASAVLDSALARAVDQNRLERRPSGLWIPAT